MSEAADLTVKAAGATNKVRNQEELEAVRSRELSLSVDRGPGALEDEGWLSLLATLQGAGTLCRACLARQRSSRPFGARASGSCLRPGFVGRI